MSVRIVKMHEAKTHLSRLVDAAARGQPFIIARSGKPLVKVVPLDERESGGGERLGFMVGEITLPEDFDRMAEGEIERLFQEGD